MYRIFVPTRGRTRKHTTRDAFALDYIGRSVTYVVPECEASFWKTQDVRFLVVPDDYRFSDIRQFILQQTAKYHVVMDDDLYPARRFKPQDWHALNLKQIEVGKRVEMLDPLFNGIGYLLKHGWLHGGVSAREGNNRVIDDYQTACREMRFHFYNAEAVRSLGYDFRRTVTKQDFDFTLWMLEHGFKNVVIYRYLQGQSGSNKDGGCSRYRDAQVLTDGANRLHKLHPRTVRVVTKKETKHSWGGGSRIDVTVMWKKAYQQGLDYVEQLRKRNPASLDAQDRTVLRLQSKLPVLPDKLFD